MIALDSSNMSIEMKANVNSLCKQEYSNKSSKDIADYNGQNRTRADVNRICVEWEQRGIEQQNGLDTKAVIQQIREHAAVCVVFFNAN